MRTQQLAIETLRALAKIAANCTTIGLDWGFGTATVFVDETHSHIGVDDASNTEDENFEQFVYDLYRVLTSVADTL